MSESGVRPTGVRHQIVFLATIMSVLLYLDRLCVGFAGDYIREDLGLTQTDMSWLLGPFFFFFYALAQVPSGWLADRYGARLMLTIYLVTWSLFTAQMGFVAGFTMLLVARLGCGVTQAGAYPTCGGVISRWIPAAKRATASAWVGLGGRIGAALVPVLTAFLMVVFVPVGTSVEFTDGDLLDVPQLTEKISAASVSPSPETPKLNPAARHLAKLVTREGSDRAALLLAMNALLERNDLFNEAAFAKLNLAREALSYAERVKAAESLPPIELRRFNRLLIEAAFPGEIRKLYGRGWRSVLILYGLSGLLVAVGIWFVFRERPEEHPGVNDAERALIEANPLPNAATAGRAGRLPIRPLLTNLSLWANCGCQIGTNVGWVFLVTWLSRYFIDVHGVPILERGILVMVPSFIGMMGGFLGGRWCDWLLPRIGLKWSRRFPPVVTRFVAAAGYALCLLFAAMPDDSPLNSPWAFTIAFSLIYFAVDLGQSATWAYAQDVGGKYVGAVLGWGNMWGNLGAGVALPAYNLILGEAPTVREWNHLFWLGLVSFIFSALCALGMDATQPIFREQPTGSPPDSPYDSKTAKS